MFHRIGKFFTLLSVLTLSAVFSLTAHAQDKDWRPVSPAELQMKTSRVEPDADAEAIFWEVRVDDGSSTDLIMKHYIRVKVFNERGREKYSKVDIPFVKGSKVKNIMARVIKTDGSIVELAKADVFEREIAKTDKVKIKAKSFAVPSIEPGVILEYQYQVFLPQSSANNMRMEFQQDIPIEKISYLFKPAANVRYMTFNMDDNKFIKDKNGFYRATLENVPAIKSEPRMPPEDEVRSWLLLYYTSNLKADSADFWANAGYDLVQNFEIKDTLKPGKELKAAAATITAGADSPDDQMAKLYQFCKTRVKNITYDATLTDDQKDEIKPNKSTGDTYKKLQGTSVDINELFASLATAAGFEARLVFGGDRSQMFFNPNQAHTSFIHFTGIGVKINGRWKYYDPGSLFVPYGMMSWTEEDTSVLLLGYKDYITTKTPMSEADKSMAKRTGRFKLLEDGTLEGTVKIEYEGQFSNSYKTDNYSKSSNQREENLKEEIKKQMSTAEISDIGIENVSDPEKPFTYQFKIRVPNYAQKTGKRLFLQPGFFEYGKEPEFSTATRKYDIYFSYPWAENDDVEIELPKNFSLDSADQPGTIADPQKISSLDINIKYDKTKNALKYYRKFYFGGGNNVLFPNRAYEPLKSLFDAFHKADTHTITLKQN